ncbi:hypothetical protein A1Q1_06365 [Trichosporon asahii var. asahii CBS 2479]|uniref:Uncharacterized protein n=1 Tax=Trichosporon asahii var. asahii (strain ATCC 90039 / CBS 2479 / JCM 2466 / KCTC 7840 / NBRC 103889/ NCYC 2677 / UAMH 7654) TaxID=1186058 RepID=J6ER84_TRIAS|nr:hypothetical protein A1Q1_06365 [Trichosporon asahii var. asahii CBS 2479]EJT45227.1 hypothetical protein A1Q1_06365 [Trichosporon asahii var. asahii CBS 2479]
MTPTTLRVPDILLDELHAYHPGVFVFAEKGFPFPLLRDEAEAAITLVNEVSNDPRFSIDARDQAMIFLRKALNNMEIIFGESDSEDEDDDDDEASFFSGNDDGEVNHQEEETEGAGAESGSHGEKDRISTLEREIEDLRERVDELEDFRQRMNDLSDSLARIAAIPSMTPPASQAPDLAPESGTESPVDAADISRESADTVPSFEKHSPDAPDAIDAANAPGTPEARPVSVLLPRQTGSIPTVSKRGGSRSSSDSGQSKVTKVRPRRRQQDTHRSRRSYPSRRSQLAQSSHRSKLSETSSADIGSVLAQPPSRDRSVSEKFIARLNEEAARRGLFRNHGVFDSRSPSPDSSRRNQLSIRSQRLARTKLDMSSVRSQLSPMKETPSESPKEAKWERKSESTQAKLGPKTSGAVSFPPGTIPEDTCTSWECEHNPPPAAAASAPTSTRQRVLSWKARWTRERGDARWARPESPPGSHSRDKRTRALVAKLERLTRY